MARPLALVIAASAPLLVACHYEYVPRTPAKNASGPVRVRVDRIRLSLNAVRDSSWTGSVSFGLSLTAPPATQLVGASTATAAARPCRRGVDATFVAVDGHPVSLDSSVPVEGHHRVEMRFLHPSGSDDERPAIDLEFDTPEGPLCERVVVTGPPDPGWHSVHRNDAFGMENRLLVPTRSVGETTFVLPLQIGILHRFGDTDVSVSPGLFTVAGCPSGVCRPAQRGTSPGLGVPFAVEATWRPGGSDRFGMGVRLDEQALWVPLRSGTRFTLLHGLGGVFHFSVLPSGPGSYPKSPRVVSLDIEAPVGVLAAHEETGYRIAPYFGIGISTWFWH